MPPFFKALLAIFMLTISHYAFAGDYLDNLKNRYLELERSAKDYWAEKTADAPPSTEPPDVSTEARKNIFSASEFPADWSFEFVEEPTFPTSLLKVEAGKEHPQTVVLLHGLGQSGFRDWLGQIDFLKQHFHVISFDLPGFGFSSTPEGRYSPTNYSKVVHWIVSKYANSPKVHVVGHSMGGAVTLRYASEFPDEVDRVVLADVAGVLERTAFLKHSAEIPMHIQEAPTLLTKVSAQIKDLSDSFVELSGFGPDPAGFLLENDSAWNLMLSDSPNLNAGFSLVEEDFNLAVRTFPHDTTIIWGEQDKVAPLRTGQSLNALIPRSRLITLASAEHSPMRTHVDEFNKLLADALNNPFHAEKPKVSEQKNGALLCKNETNKAYSGIYDVVVLDHCTAISLNNISAKEIRLTESIAFINNAIVTSDKVGISATESVVKITASQISGETAIYSKGSRLDIAATNLKAEKVALVSRKKSKVIMSVSQINSAVFDGFTHGAYKLEDQSLDQQLAFSQ